MYDIDAPEWSYIAPYLRKEALIIIRANILAAVSVD